MQDLLSYRNLNQICKIYVRKPISLVESFSLQPKKLYSQLSRLKSTKSLPLYLQMEGNQLLDDTAKANALNRFFNSTFSNSSFSLPPISDLPTPSTQFHEISFYSLEVYEAVCKLDTSKAMGNDNLHPHLLKCVRIQTQIIPEEWKVHKVIPVPKKGDLILVQNYRPISLSILSKVLERLIYDKIINFITPKLTSYQFGFLKHR